VPVARLGTGKRQYAQSAAHTNPEDTAPAFARGGRGLFVARTTTGRERGTGQAGRATGKTYSKIKEERR
jgi:hypothetical protein